MKATLAIVNLYLQNLADGLRFYTETLGFEIVPERTSPVFVTLRTGAALLALQDATILPPGSAGQPGGMEVGLMVEDVDAVFANWISKGVVSLSQPQDLPFGRSFLARDCEGHLLRVYTPIARG